MTQFLFYLICLVIGAGIGYLYFQRKNKSLLKDITNLIAQLKSGKSIRLSPVYIKLPEDVKPVAEALEDLSHHQTDPEVQLQGNSIPIEQTDSSKKQLNNMLIINELGQRITSSLHLEETYEHLYTTLNSMMDAAVVELGVYDTEHEEWAIYSKQESPAGHRYHNHVAEWVQQNDRKVILEDAEKDYGRYVGDPLRVQNGELAQSILSFPIHLNDEVGGVISVISFRRNAFDDYHIESIQHLLGFLTVALRNAHTHEQVNRLKIRAEESEKHEQQFLANMSHEIRTPMNAVLGMTNLLLDSELSEKQLKYLNAIKVSSKNLLVIINDVLDLSKLEAGRMEIEKIPFSIHEVVQNVIDTSKFKAEEKGLRFEMKLGEKLPDVVKGDPTRLNQILTNLCSNAVKFTEKGGVTVEVTKPENSHFIKFRVKDTGIGIPADKVHLLFGNFKQVDSSTFRKYGGTGLGLAISKTLIELQGGKVEVESEPGQGSTFTVMIPYEQGTLDELKALHHETAVDGAGLQGIKILVAEDNEYNQIVVEDTLTSLIKDVHIEIAANGLIAVEMVRDNDYDIVLMDAQMPEMDGLDATRNIRKLQDEKKRTIPIIALTASVHKADIDKCLESGMDSFVPKPFNNDELLGAIAQFYHNSDGVSNKKEPQNNKADMVEEPTAINRGGQVTDMGFLTDFTEGDKERMRKYVLLYLKLLPDNLKKLEAALAMKDGEALLSVMHSMRPHLNYMGMKASADMAAGVENKIREGARLADVQEVVKQVMDNCVKSRDELEQELLSLV